MDQRFATSRMTVDLDALARNWKLLRSFAPGAVVAAAVKADGYGLGAEQVVTALNEGVAGTGYERAPAPLFDFVG